MDYLIKEVAKLVGVSPTTIRYYDKIGLIKVTKKPDTGYRTFQPIDINVLMRARMLHSYGFSMNDVGNILNFDDISDIVEALKRQQDIVRQQICEKQYLNQKLGEQISRLEQIGVREQFEYTVQKRPAMFGIIYRDATSIYKDKELRKVVAQWMEYVPYIHPLIILDPDSDGTKEDIFRMGLCITEEDAEFIQLKPCPQIQYIASAPCMHTISEVCVNPSRMEGIAAKMVKGLTDKGFESTGPIYGRSLFSYRKNDELWSVNEHWLSI